MPLGEVFDLGRAYSQAQNIKASQADMQERATRTQILDREQQRLQISDEQKQDAIQKLAEYEAFKDNPEFRARKTAEIKAAGGAQYANVTEEQAMSLYGAGLYHGAGVEPPGQKQLGALYKLSDGTYGAAEDARGQTFYREPRSSSSTVIVPPAGQREYEFLQSLPPDEQERYLNMKRASATPGAAADIAGAKARATEQAKADVAAETDLPRLEGNAKDMRAQLKNLRTSSGMRYIFGAASLAPIVPGTAQADAFAVWEQIQGKAFLEAFNTLKGGGQITEKEGEKATSAITRLANRQQSLGSAMKAIRELEEVVSAAEARARSKAARGKTPAPAGSGVVNFEDLPE